MKSVDVSVLGFWGIHFLWRHSKAFAALLTLCLFAGVPAGCSNDNPGAPVPEFRIVSDVTDPFCSVDNTACEAIVTIPFHLEEGDTSVDYGFEIHLDLLADGTIDETLAVQDVLTGEYPDYLITDTLPLGGHEILIDVTDAAGITHTGSIAFDVVDCRAPTPICISGIAFELQELAVPEDVDGDGDIDLAAMVVHALDLIAAPITDCSMPIVYSVNRTGEIADIEQSTMVLTCDDVGTLTVELHAWDSAVNPLASQPDGSTGGPNHGSCTLYFIVQDNMAPCN